MPPRPSRRCSHRWDPAAGPPRPTLECRRIEPPSRSRRRRRRPPPCPSDCPPGSRKRPGDPDRSHPPWRSARPARYGRRPRCAPPPTRDRRARRSAAPRPRSASGPPRGKPLSPPPSLVDLGALDQERDPHVGAVLVEVLAPNSGRDDVDGADVAQGSLSLAQRLFRSVVGGRLGTSDQLDDFHDSHLAPPSESCTVSLALTPSSSAACCHGPTGAGASPGTAPTSPSNRAMAAATAAASSPLGDLGATGQA